MALASPILGLDPAKALDQYPHRTWDSTDGLPHDSVRAIAQSADGYLWLGTQAGLSRFDGKNFRNLDGDDHPALGDGHIEDLAIDEAGRLWIGTYDGLVRFVDGRMRRFGVEDGLPGSRVLSLHAAGETLWIGTYEAGLARMRRGRIERYSEAGGSRHPIVPHITTDPRRGILWVGSFGGLHRFRNGELRLFGTEDGLASPRVWDTRQRSDGSLWVATDRGLHLLSTSEPGEGDGAPILATHTPADGLSHPRILSVLEDRHGQVWAGTFGGGLNRLGLDGRWSHLEDPAPGHDAIFWTLFEDRDGNLWGGTLLDGLHQFRDGAFTHFGNRRGLPPGPITGISQGSDGEILVTIRNRGVAELGPDGRFRIASEPKSSEPIRNTRWPRHRDPLGRLWIGTSDGFALLDDRDETLARSSLRIFGRDQGLPRAPIVTFWGEADGDLWIGTGGDGLYRLAADQVEAEQPRLRGLTTVDGLYDDDVRLLIGDDRGSLWMACSRGVVRLEIHDLEARMDDPEHPLAQVAYHRADGLPGPPRSSVGLRDRDGRLWFATDHGVARIDPSALRLVDPPTPRIESMEVDGEALPFHPPPRLDPRPMDVTFRFSAPALSAPDRIRLHYRLLGLETTWTEVSESQVAEYTHLPPGPYSFQVMTTDALGKPSDPLARVDFHVEGAFVGSPLFVAVLGLGLVLLFYAVHLLRVADLERRRHRLEAEVEAALGEVKVLRGMLPICGWCKCIRDDEGFWQGLENYLVRHSEAQLQTSLCPECTARRAADTPGGDPGAPPDGPPRTDTSPGIGTRPEGTRP